MHARVNHTKPEKAWHTKLPTTLFVTKVNMKNEWQYIITNCADLSSNQTDKDEDTDDEELPCFPASLVSNVAVSQIKINPAIDETKVSEGNKYELYLVSANNREKL